jgi:hypothetical protein
MSCDVLGNDLLIGFPNFTTKISHFGATPLYLPSDKIPVPAAIPATWVPQLKNSTYFVVYYTQNSK